MVNYTVSVLIPRDIYLESSAQMSQTQPKNIESDDQKGGRSKIDKFREGKGEHSPLPKSTRGKKLKAIKNEKKKISLEQRLEDFWKTLPPPSPTSETITIKGDKLNKIIQALIRRKKKRESFQRKMDALWIGDKSSLSPSSQELKGKELDEAIDQIRRERSKNTPKNSLNKKDLKEIHKKQPKKRKNKLIENFWQEDPSFTNTVTKPYTSQEDKQKAIKDLLDSRYIQDEKHLKMLYRTLKSKGKRKKEKDADKIRRPTYRPRIDPEDRRLLTAERLDRRRMEDEKHLRQVTQNVGYSATDTPSAMKGVVMSRPASDGKGSDNEILTHFTPNIIPKVKELLTILRRKPEIISWKLPTLEVVIRDNTIPNSRLTDILGYLFSEQAKNKKYISSVGEHNIPLGSQDFIRALKDYFPVNEKLVTYVKFNGKQLKKVKDTIEVEDAERGRQTQIDKDVQRMEEERMKLLEEEAERRREEQRIHEQNVRDPNILEMIEQNRRKQRALRRRAVGPEEIREIRDKAQREYARKRRRALTPQEIRLTPLDMRGILPILSPETSPEPDRDHGIPLAAASHDSLPHSSKEIDVLENWMTPAGKTVGQYMGKAADATTRRTGWKGVKTTPIWWWNQRRKDAIPERSAYTDVKKPSSEASRYLPDRQALTDYTKRNPLPTWTVGDTDQPAVRSPPPRLDLDDLTPTPRKRRKKKRRSKVKYIDDDDSDDENEVFFETKGPDEET